MDRWRGKVALVTGASAGIGAAVCRELVKHGMTVVGCARRVDRIAEIAEEDAVKAAPGELFAMRCDLSDESDILKLFDDIRKKLGRLDVLVNNAGLTHMASLVDGETSLWKNILDVNVMALCICSREALKLMKEQNIDDGHIINISSIGGHFIPNVTIPGVTFYCGTKFMVRALTEGLRRELKAQGSHIRIGSLSPGMVETEFMDQFLKDDPTHNSQAIFSSIKSLESKDVADFVVHVLASPPHVEIHDIIIRPREETF